MTIHDSDPEQSGSFDLRRRPEPSRPPPAWTGSLRGAAERPPPDRPRSHRGESRPGTFSERQAAERNSHQYPHPAARRSEPDPTYGLPPILTVEEAARFLRVNAKTVYAAIEQRQIPAKKISDNRIVIVRDRLLRWLASDACELPQKRRR